jgi:RimJ/RimL family protein N-acetyltransferase
MADYEITLGYRKLKTTNNKDMRIVSPTGSSEISARASDTPTSGAVDASRQEGHHGVAVPTVYFLTSSRLGFRQWTEHDGQLMTEFLSDPSITKPLNDGAPFHPDTAIEFLKFNIDLQKASDVQYWPIFLNETEEHVGICGLRLIPDREDIYQLGYYIRAKFHGQGYATEAAKAVIRYAFENLYAEGISAGHSDDNSRSGKVLINVGMKKLTKYPDKNWYRILKQEYFDGVSC